MTSPDHITLSGAPEGYDARLLARELARGAPVVHVARDDKRMEAMRSALAFFAPDALVLSFPAWDCLPYDRVSPNADVSATRMATLAALAQGLRGPFILLTTLNAATQRLPARAVLTEASFTAKVGGRVNEAGLRDFLVRMGFSQSPTVTEPGDYAIRGGIIDIYPPGEGGPVRLDLFGDVLDGARRFDPATQRTTEKLAACRVRAGLGSDPGRGRDHALSAELPDRIRCRGHRRPALRSGERRPQARGDGALAAVLP